MIKINLDDNLSKVINFNTYIREENGNIIDKYNNIGINNIYQYICGEMSPSE